LNTEIQASTFSGTFLKVFGGGARWVVEGDFGPKPKFCSFDLDLDQAEQLKFYKDRIK
jgi:hypothetical protein